MLSNGDSLLAKVVESLSSVGVTPSGPGGKSILEQAAASFDKRPDAESTMPTGFDPQAATLFEAVVEAAFLVANADGVFDQTERRTFESVVAQACKNSVQKGKVQALVSDLCDQLNEDGMEQRIRWTAQAVSETEHQHEVLRIAALMAYISEGVQESEREVLLGLAKGFGLGQEAVNAALSQAEAALAGGG